MHSLHQSHCTSANIYYQSPGVSTVILKTRKQIIATHLPTPPENVTTLITREMQNFSSDRRFVAFLQTLVAVKRASCVLSSAALKTTGCDVWQLERQSSNVTTCMCSQWPPSAWIHASSLFRHWSIALYTRSAEIQPMSQQAAAATRPYRGLVLDTRAPPVACPIRGNRAMQLIGSNRQQYVNS